VSDPTENALTYKCDSSAPGHQTMNGGVCAPVHRVLAIMGNLYIIPDSNWPIYA